MSTKLFSLTIASLALTIARPALAASGATLASSIGYVGPMLMIIGAGLIAVESFALRQQGVHPEEGDQLVAASKTALAGKLLLLGGFGMCIVGLFS
jgi:hypothetical protein